MTSRALPGALDTHLEHVLASLFSPSIEPYPFHHFTIHTRKLSPALQWRHTIRVRREAFYRETIACCATAEPEAAWLRPRDSLQGIREGVKEEPATFPPVRLRVAVEVSMLH